MEVVEPEEAAGEEQPEQQDAEDEQPEAGDAEPQTAEVEAAEVRRIFGNVVFYRLFGKSANLRFWFGPKLAGSPTMFA